MKRNLARLVAWLVLPCPVYLVAAYIVTGWIALAAIAPLVCLPSVLAHVYLAPEDYYD
jgi:hypothetical protein